MKLRSEHFVQNSKEANQTGTKFRIPDKRHVTTGPQLWVANLLHEKGNFSTQRIWEEFLRDQTTPNSLIPSKSFLKERILHQMEAQGKIKRDRALDMPKFKRAGWKLNTTKAFKNVAPSIVMKLDPIP